MKPIFHNRDNKVHVVKDEFNNAKQIWESRSVAVVGIVFALEDGKLFFLAEKRSNTMADAPGKWCLPCGYLDWDESGWDALTREIYEETSLYIVDYEHNLKTDNDKKPFFVNTSPTENRQNVALSYYMIFEFPKGELPRHIESHTDSEIEAIRWIPYERRGNYVWAFDHDKRINMALHEVLAP